MCFSRTRLRIASTMEPLTQITNTRFPWISAQVTHQRQRLGHPEWIWALERTQIDPASSLPAPGQPQGFFSKCPGRQHFWHVTRTGKVRLLSHCWSQDLISGHKTSFRSPQIAHFGGNTRFLSTLSAAPIKIFGQWVQEKSVYSGNLYEAQTTRSTSYCEPVQNLLSL